MNENRDVAVSEVGEQPVNAIEAAFDVICPGASANAGGSNGSGGKAENSAAVAQCFTCCQGVHEAAKISHDIIQAG